MSSRSLLLVLGAVAVMSAAAPRAAQAQTTALFVDSFAGETIGAGHVWTYNAVDATFTAGASSAGGASMAIVTTGSPSVRWDLTFVAPGTNRMPTTGVYESARRAPFTKFVGLSVTGDGRGCNDFSGRFVVLEAVYAGDGSVTRFAADFEQHCEEDDPPLFGAVRYNSTVSTLVPFGGLYPRYQLIVTPPANGSVQGLGISCGSSGSQCAVSLGAPATRAITAVPDPGFLFAGWTDGCSGGPRTTIRLNMPRTCSATFTPFATASPRTLAVITGMGEQVIRGVPVIAAPANSLWSLGSRFQNGFTVHIDFVGQRRQSYISFDFVPPTGETFEVGREYQTMLSADATHASLVTASDGSGCAAEGRFTLRDWAEGPDGEPTRFAVDLWMPCGGAGLYATLLYASPYDQYGRLDVAGTALHFTAVHDQSGIVSHSADQVFNVSPSGPSTMHWDVGSDQPWLTATPLSGTVASTVTAKVRTGAYVSGTSPATGHLQAFARGILNVPDPVTVTLDLVAPDTTVRPFAVFRPGGRSWFMPNQSPFVFGQANDIPVSGDFDGDGALDIAMYSPVTGGWFVQGRSGPLPQLGGEGDIPVPADYNGDGITDFAVFRPTGISGQWFIFNDFTLHLFGARGDVPVPGDYDGDGLADLAVFRPATGTWSILRSSTGQTVTAQFGLPGDIPLVADFDADRRIDLAVFRPSTGVWYITLSAGGTYTRQFGLPGDIPVPLDATGDGLAELRVWRPATGVWYTFDRTLSQASSQQYGLPGDVPVMARPELRRARSVDMDGDRRADVAIYRPSSGEWFTRQSVTGYSTFTNLQWGLASDIPVPGDYDGDHRANPAVYRPSTGEWFVLRFDGAVLTRVWGLPNDLPVPADYDGDGRIDIAVFRPSTGEWFILSSSSDFGQYWIYNGVGEPGDRPVPADFDGDGRADPAIYRPSTNEWLVAPNSSYVRFMRQWGLSGDLPIARDFDGDGRADLAIYRPSTGEWHVLGAISGVPIFTRQWGLNGDVPVADDYDGDGVADVAVYRPISGEWFVLPSSGAPSFVLQWGLAADVPVTRR
jgi:hypothetical protein